MKNNSNSCYFNLYTNCIPVKGINRCSIIDLQKHEIHLIPNTLYYILSKYSNKTIKWVKNKFNNNPIIDGYFDYLSGKNLIFFTTTPQKQNFPILNITSYLTPSYVTNSIIEISKNSNHPYKNIFKQLSKLNCESIELRFLNIIELNELQNIIKIADISSFRSIYLFIPFDIRISRVTFENIIQKFPRINNIFIYNYPYPRKIISLGFNKHIIYEPQKNIHNYNCGNIRPEYFSPCTRMFCEAISFNTCLYKKISIDSEGYIRNCPSMKEHYGNIKEKTIFEIINNPNFQKVWFIKKDEIEICKECEFRYVCLDCRAFITDKNNIYSKPLKCKYDPYTSIWEK